MNDEEFYELYNNIVVPMTNKIYNEVSNTYNLTVDEFHLFDLHYTHGIKADIKRNYNSNLKRIKKQELFNDNQNFLLCIKIASLCDALLRNKLICFTVQENTSTDVLMVNYKIALEVVLENLLYELRKIDAKKYKELILPTEDFKNLLLYSIIINDNTEFYMFDILNFALLLLTLYKYNI